MKIETIQILLFLISMPLVLFLAAFFRCNVVSLVYLICLLVIPMIPLKHHTIQVFLVGLGIFSGLVTLTHIVFQIIDTFPSMNYLFKPCSETDSILYQIGFLRFKGLPFHQICRVFGLDLAVAIVSLVICLISRHLEKMKGLSLEAGNNAEVNEEEERVGDAIDGHVNDEGIVGSQMSPNDTSFNIVQRAVRRLTKPIAEVHKQLWRDYYLNISLTIITMAFCYAAGIMSPSLPSMLYFILALLEVFAWAYYGQVLSQRFFYMSSFLVVLTSVHTLLYYLYQLPIINQEALPQNELSTRLLGINILLYNNCSDPGSIHINKENQWFKFVAPALTLILYFLAALELQRRWENAGSILTSTPPALNPTSKSVTTNLSTTNLHDNQPCSSSMTEHDNDDDDDDLEHPADAEYFRRFVESHASELSVSMQRLVDASQSANQNEEIFIVDVTKAAMKHSYILSFVSMLGWSVLYVSWMSFALLFTGCVLMCIPNTRKAFLYVSPLLVLYGVCLLTIQYIYGLNLTEMELPNKAEIGLQRAQVPVVPLSVQFGFLCTFLLTFRLFLSSPEIGGNCYNNIELNSITHDGPSEESSLVINKVSENRLFTKISDFMQSLCCKYWIVLCCVMFLVMSLQLPPVIIRIFYLIMLMYFLSVFMMSYRIWRIQLMMFWWIVIVYSMVVLCLIYTYQFEDFENFLKRNISPTLLEDIGLEKFATAILLSRLLTPVTFIILVVFQTHYFHDKFLEYTNIRTTTADPTEEVERQNPTSNQTTVVNQSKKSSLAQFFEHHLVKQVFYFINYFIDLLWRLLELHCHKLIALVTMLMAISEPCAAHFVLVVAIAVLLPSRTMQYTLSCFIFLWVGVDLLLNMGFQLKSLENFMNSTLVNNCSFPVKTDDFTWAGISRQAKMNNVVTKGLIMTLAAIHFAMRYRKRIAYNLLGPCKGELLFSDVDNSNFNQSFIFNVKHYLNKWFAMIGLELCLIMASICACVRLDIVGLIYIISIVPFLLSSKSTCRKLWPFYCAFLSILLCLQFAICVGLPPGLCIEYPFKFNLSQAITENNLKKWLFLPDYINPPNSRRLIVDFFQLLLASCQNNVFKSHENVAIDEDEHVNYFPNDMKNDFVTHKKSMMDYVKHAIFYWFYWLVLIYLFVYAVLYSTLTSLGYLIISFCFLWWGQNLMLRKRSTLIKLWNIIVIWVVIVICLLISLELPACVYPNTFPTCALASILGCVCLDPYVKPIDDKNCPDNIFSTSTATTTMFTFIFVIFQGKIFRTKNFFYIVFDLAVKAKFSSRGANMIKDRLLEEGGKQKRDNDLEITRIRQKLDAICKRQEDSKSSGLNTYQEHYMRIRSGDINLFGDPQDEDDDMRLDKSMSQFFLDNENKGTLPRATFSENLGEDYEISNSFKQVGTTHQRHSSPAVNPIKLFSQVLESGPVNVANELRLELKRSPSIGNDTENEIPTSTETVLRQRSLNQGSSVSNKLEKVNEDSDEIKEEEEEEEVGGEGGEEKQQSSFTSFDSKKPQEVNEQNKETIVEETKSSKFWACLSIAYTYPMILANQLVQLLKAHTDDYRSMTKSLNEEQLQVKEQLLKEFVNTKIFEFDVVNNRLDEIVSEITRHSKEVSPLAIDQPTTSSERPLSASSKTSLNAYGEEERQKTNAMEPQKNVLIAIGTYLYGIISMYSVSICYVVMITNHVFNSSVLSLPYPLLVFLWGMFSVPRPGKKFWIIVITYTQIVILLKYASQFKFTEKGIDNPVWLYILGDQQILESDLVTTKKSDRSVMTKYGIYWDVLLLIVIFIHRSYLQNNGLWHYTFANLKKQKQCNEKEDEIGNGEEDENRQIDCENDNGKTLDQNRGELINNGINSSLTVSNGNKKSIEESFNKENNETESTNCGPFGTFKRFFNRLTNNEFNRTVNLYVYMFLFEFLSFVVIIVGYSDFGVDSSQENALNLIQQNKVPIPFLFMLLVQFVFIVIDRSLFLKRNVYGKFIFQIVHVVIIHIWLFFILPYLNGNRSVTYSNAVMLLYIFKCIYFTVSAFQVKSGYPMRILGNFLYNRCGYVNLIVFKVYMSIPFLYELRGLTDWLWTNTTLSLSHWMTVEDIMAKVYVQRCWRYAEYDSPTPKGERYVFAFKLLSAGFLVLFIFICLWGPLALATLINVTSTTNPPTDCTLTITMGSFPALYSYTALSSNIKQDDKIIKCFNDNEKSNISSVKPEDIRSVFIDGSSGQLWTITPPGVDLLLEKLEERSNETTIQLSSDFSCRRDPTRVTQSMTYSVNYRADSRELTFEERSILKDMLNDTFKGTNTSTLKTLQLMNIFPLGYNLRLKQMDEMIFNGESPSTPNGFPIKMNIELELKRKDSYVWWEMQQLVYKNDSDQCLKSNGSSFTSTNNLQIITINDRVLEGVLGSLFMNIGIIGLYAAYLLVAQRLLRSLYDGLAYNICYNELPFVDRIFYLCQDIYLVRESENNENNEEVEEALVARLFFLYRSHETLIKWTQPSAKLIEKFSQPPEMWQVTDAKKQN